MKLSSSFLDDFVRRADAFNTRVDGFLGKIELDVQDLSAVQGCLLTQVDEIWLGISRVEGLVQHSADDSLAHAQEEIWELEERVKVLEAALGVGLALATSPAVEAPEAAPE